MATKKSATSSAAAGDEQNGFTTEERDAIKDRAKETRAASRTSAKKADGETDVLAKIAEMPDADQTMAKRIHEVITAAAPELAPKTWYGMPAYAKDGKVICFFQSSAKFKTRYATLGFNESANLDDGTIWPTAFAVIALNSEVEARISELVKKAVS